MSKRYECTHLVQLHEPFAQSVDFISVDWSHAHKLTFERCLFGVAYRTTKLIGEGEDSQLLPWTMLSSICEFALPILPSAGRVSWTGSL